MIEVMTLDSTFKEMGSRIASRRKHLKINQNTLAEQLGISNNHLSSLEKGKVNPSLELLIELCNALKVTPDYLLMGVMHQNNIPLNIYEELRLCSEHDIQIIQHIVHFMAETHSEKWNDDNFV